MQPPRRAQSPTPIEFSTEAAGVLIQEPGLGVGRAQHGAVSSDIIFDRPELLFAHAAHRPSTALTFQPAGAIAQHDEERLTREGLREKIVSRNAAYPTSARLPRQCTLKKGPSVSALQSRREELLTGPGWDWDQFRSACRLLLLVSRCPWKSSRRPWLGLKERMRITNEACQ